MSPVTKGVEEFTWKLGKESLEGIQTSKGGGGETRSPLSSSPVPWNYNSDGSSQGCLDNSLKSILLKSIGYSLKCLISLPWWGHKLYSQTLPLPVLSDNQTKESSHGRKIEKQNKKCFNITVITAAAKKSIWFLPLSYSKKLLRCSSQVWGSCFDYKLFEYYISSQTATFCCRQIELFSYKYSQYFDNVLTTTSNGYLTGSPPPTSKSSEWPP